MEEWSADLGALANEHEDLGLAQSLGERVDVLDVIVPDLDIVSRQLREAVERAQRVVVVVEDGDLHRGRSSALVGIAANCRVPSLPSPAAAGGSTFDDACCVPPGEETFGPPRPAGCLAAIDRERPQPNQLLIRERCGVRELG